MATQEEQYAVIQQKQSQQQQEAQALQTESQNIGKRKADAEALAQQIKEKQLLVEQKYAPLIKDNKFVGSQQSEIQKTMETANTISRMGGDTSQFNPLVVASLQQSQFKTAQEYEQYKSDISSLQSLINTYNPQVESISKDVSQYNLKTSSFQLSKDQLKSEIDSYNKQIDIYNQQQKIVEEAAKNWDITPYISRGGFSGGYFGNPNPPQEKYAKDFPNIYNKYPEWKGHTAAAFEYELKMPYGGESGKKLANTEQEIRDAITQLYPEWQISQLAEIQFAQKAAQQMVSFGGFFKTPETFSSATAPIGTITDTQKALQAHIINPEQAAKIEYLKGTPEFASQEEYNKLALSVPYALSIGEKASILGSTPEQRALESSYSTKSEKLGQSFVNTDYPTLFHNIVPKDYPTLAGALSISQQQLEQIKLKSEWQAGFTPYSAALASAPIGSNTSYFIVKNQEGIHNIVRPDWRMSIDINPLTGKGYTAPDLEFQAHAPFIKQTEWYNQLSVHEKALAIGGSMNFGIWSEYIQSKYGESVKEFNKKNIPSIYNFASFLTEFDPISGFNLESVSIGIGDAKQTINYTSLPKPSSSDILASKLYDYYDIGKYENRTLFDRLEIGLYKGATSDVTIATGSAYGVGLIAGGISKGIALTFGAKAANVAMRTAGYSITTLVGTDVALKTLAGNVGGAAVEGGVFMATLPIAASGYRMGAGIPKIDELEAIRTARTLEELPPLTLSNRIFMAKNFIIQHYLGNIDIPEGLYPEKAIKFESGAKLAIELGKMKPPTQKPLDFTQVKAFKNPYSEKSIWYHGASEENIESIIKYGLNTPLEGEVTASGRGGSYITKIFDYANIYAKKGGGKVLVFELSPAEEALLRDVYSGKTKSELKNIDVGSLDIEPIPFEVEALVSKPIKPFAVIEESGVVSKISSKYGIELIKSVKNIEGNFGKDVETWIRENPQQNPVIGGSAAARTQFMRARLPGDIDIDVLNPKEAALSLYPKAQSFFGKENVNLDINEKFNQATIEIYGQHGIQFIEKSPNLFSDTVDIGQHTGLPFTSKSPIEIEGINYKQAAELMQRKADSILRQQGKTINPQPHRMKDITDFENMANEFLAAKKTEAEKSFWLLREIRENKVQNLRTQLETYKMYSGIDVYPTTKAAIRYMIEHPLDTIGSGITAFGTPSETYKMFPTTKNTKITYPSDYKEPKYPSDYKQLKTNINSYFPNYPSFKGLKNYPINSYIQSSYRYPAIKLPYYPSAPQNIPYYPNTSRYTPNYIRNPSQYNYYPYTSRVPYVYIPNIQKFLGTDKIPNIPKFKLNTDIIGRKGKFPHRTALPYQFKNPFATLEDVIGNPDKILGF